MMKSVPESEREFEYGFIAQEVEKVLPELVKRKNGVRFLDYKGFIPLLHENSLHLASRVKKVEDRLEYLMILEERIEKLENFQAKIVSNFPSIFI